MLIQLVLATTAVAHLTVEKIEVESGYTQIKLQNVDIVWNYDTVFHIVNIDELEIITNLFEANINASSLTEDKKLVLEHDLRVIRNKLKTLIPHRQKRGLLNFIGTAHKWLYGTMDNNDREEIEKHLNVIDINDHNLIENSNQQVRINKNFNETFIKLKEAIENDRNTISRQFENISKDQKFCLNFVCIH